MNDRLDEVIGVAGHRARDPPDPIPNSEVKLRSVSGVSVVFGHAKPGKLAAPSGFTLAYGGEIPKFYYDNDGKSSKFITNHVVFWSDAQ